MKGDMGGAACVAGLMLALAKRKAKVNAIGAIGIVENMPDGKAQRPGDIVKSMSGQTIAVLNTDAEGRLVLADVLWYIQDTLQAEVHDRPRDADRRHPGGARQGACRACSPTMTNWPQRLSEAGYATGEKVWRMPLAPEYDKIIDHDVADMKNTGGRNAGSITAAQFLQRFVNNVPWAHLDVAGTAMDAPRKRHQPELGLRLGRAPAQPVGGPVLREVDQAGSDGARGGCGSARHQFDRQIRCRAASRPGP